MAPSYLIFEDFIIDGLNNPYSDQAGGRGVPLVYTSGGASFNQFMHLEIRNNGGTGLGFSPNNGASNYNQVLYNLFHDNGTDPTFTLPMLATVPIRTRREICLMEIASTTITAMDSSYAAPTTLFATTATTTT